MWIVSLYNWTSLALCSVLYNWTGMALWRESFYNLTGVVLSRVPLHNWTGVVLWKLSLYNWTGVVLCKVSLSYSPISLGRCGCSCIQPFRCSTASLTRLSFRQNSLISFSRNSSVGDSITSCDILIWRQEKCVALTALYGVPLYFAHYCTLSILMIQFHAYLTSTKHHHLQYPQPPPISLCYICTHGTLL